MIQVVIIFHYLFFCLQILWTEQQVVKKRIKRDLLDLDHDLSSSKHKWNPKFKDPQWPKMWYLVSKPMAELDFSTSAFSVVCHMKYDLCISFFIIELL